MSQSANAWPKIVEQIFEGFLSVESATPDWLEVPGTGRHLEVDILYPVLGIAIWFKDSRSALQRDRAPRGGMRADLCRQAGIALVVVDGEVGAHSQTFAEIHTALSAAARRAAQQKGAQEAKLDLLPRIAAAKATCRQIQDDLSAAPPVYPKNQRPQRRRRAEPSSRQILAQDPLAGLGIVLGPTFAILRRVALFVAVLLAVNATTYLVVNYLDLRGPMAYSYVPDAKIPFADVYAPYPGYLQGVVQGDFGTVSRYFSRGEIPILGLMIDKLSRSLVLVGIAVLFSVGVGITAGFLSVNYRTQRTNPLALILSLAGFSMPGFYMAILILYLMIRVAMTYGKGIFFLPTTGYGLDAHLVLPVLALSARPTAEIARLTAELLGEELPKEYIRAARAKGLPEWWVIRRHAFRNVVAAVINAMSNSWSYLLGSLVIVETVFHWGGMGQGLIDAVTFSQFAGSSFEPELIAGLATAMALLFLLADLITGLAAQALDPRLRRAHGGVA